MKKNIGLTTQARKLITALLALALLISVGQILAQHKQQSTSEDQESMQLLTILRDKQIQEREPERVAKVIERLGEIKSVEAIDDLVQHLTFSRNIQQEKIGDVVVGERFITLFGRYPAAGALFQIGKPALPALIKVIGAEETGSLAGENAIHTVTQIFRDSPAEGVSYLKDAAANASTAQAARRLSDAAERVRRFHQQ